MEDIIICAEIDVDKIKLVEPKSSASILNNIPGDLHYIIDKNGYSLLSFNCKDFELIDGYFFIKLFTTLLTYKKDLLKVLRLCTCKDCFLTIFYKYQLTFYIYFIETIKSKFSFEKFEKFLEEYYMYIYDNYIEDEVLFVKLTQNIKMAYNTARLLGFTKQIKVDKKLI